MGHGLRYTMNNLGDVVFESIDNMLNTIKSSTRGIVLTYSIYESNTKKKGLTFKVGERMIDIKRTSPELEIFDDEKISVLFKELDLIAEEIKSKSAERNERLYPESKLNTEFA